MRTTKKIRYRLEWRKFATKFLPLLSRKVCYRIGLLLGSLAALLDRGRHVALSNLRVAFSNEISTERCLDEGVRKLLPMTSKVKVPVP